MEVSTGSVTALIGAPLLLWLLPRLRSISAPDMKVNDRVAAERQHVLAFALAGGVLLLMAVVVALSFGRDAHGWTWASGALLEDLMPWRWPRIMAAQRGNRQQNHHHNSGAPDLRIGGVVGRTRDPGQHLRHSRVTTRLQHH